MVDGKKPDTDVAGCESGARLGWVGGGGVFPVLLLLATSTSR